jgi:hypothetical protein
VFVPPNPVGPTDPCRKFVQLELSGGQVAIAVDPDAAPANFIPEIRSSRWARSRRRESIDALWAASTHPRTK